MFKNEICNIILDGTSCSPSGLICLSVNNWPKNIDCSCLKTCAEVLITMMKSTMRLNNFHS